MLRKITEQVECELWHAREASRVSKQGTVATVLLRSTEGSGQGKQQVVNGTLVLRGR